MTTIDDLSPREFDSRVADYLADGEFMDAFAAMVRTAHKTGHAMPDWAQVLEYAVHDRIQADLEREREEARADQGDYDAKETA